MPTEPPPRKKRQGGSKTRTGCQTCKIRRVKCDETKPHCIRCTKTGRKCDGYTQGTLSTNANGSKVLNTRQLIPRIAGTSQERRGFHYFVSNTVAELSGFYTSSFWEKLILQASSLDPILRHAVIAIGTLHEEFANKRLSYYSKQQSDGFKFAMNQYVKAIAQLRKDLSKGSQEPLSALMACVLFVCFDSLRGFFDSAMVHLKSGLKIMEDMKDRFKDEEGIVATDIVPLFTRLNVQAILYIDTRSTPERREFVAGLSKILLDNTEVPAAFNTIGEAQVCLNRIADLVFRMFYVCDPELPMGKQPEEAFHLHLKYSRLLVSWNTSFEYYMRTKSSALSSKELRGAALLKIHHLTLSIIADVTPSFNDPRKIAMAVNDYHRFDLCKDNFRAIVRLAKSLVVATETDRRSGKPGPTYTFSTDLGIVGPLYYTAQRCTDIPTRVAALDLLLRFPRREGMWDSEASARMVRQYWEVEERYRVLQRQVQENIGLHVYIGDVVELIFDDEMKWTWRWKGAFTGPSTPTGLSYPSPLNSPAPGPVDTVARGKAESDTVMAMTGIEGDFGIGSSDLEGMVFW